jgi:hypothetical protein
MLLSLMVVAVCWEQLTLERSLAELAWKWGLSMNDVIGKYVEDCGKALNG